MANLVLDPPAPALQLISCADAPARDHRYRDSAQLGVDARRVQRTTLEWSLRNGCDVDPDAVRVVLAARQSRQGGPMHRYTANDVWRLMMTDVLGWCRGRRLPVPDGCAHAILVITQALEYTDTGHEDSDPLDEIERALEECTGIWASELDRSSATRWR